MKKQVLLSLMLLINVFACEDDDSFENNNILGENWKAQSIILKNNQVEYGIMNKDYFKQDAYVLYFNLDSTFILNTSVNSIEGELNISIEATIYFHNISGTRVGQTDDIVREIDSILTAVFESTTDFQIAEDKIELIGDKGVIKLKKMTNNE